MNNIEDQVKNLTRKEDPYMGKPILGLDWNREHRRHERDFDRRERDFGRHDLDYGRCRPDPVAVMPLAMAYVPWQCWCETYDPALGHDRGTIFPELDLPFLAGGGDC